MSKQAAALELVEFDSASHIEEVNSLDESEIISYESIRKLARLRRNLAALKSEISEKILMGARDCHKDIVNTIKVVGELNATITNENK